MNTDKTQTPKMSTVAPSQPPAEQGGAESSMNDTLLRPAAQQTPEQRAYFDGWFDGTQYLRVLIIEGKERGMDRAERHIQKLRDKRLADTLAAPSPASSTSAAFKLKAATPADEQWARDQSPEEAIPAPEVQSRSLLSRQSVLRGEGMPPIPAASPARSAAAQAIIDEANAQFADIKSQFERGEFPGAPAATSAEAGDVLAKAAEIAGLDDKETQDRVALGLPPIKDMPQNRLLAACVVRQQGEISQLKDRVFDRDKLCYSQAGTIGLAGDRYNRLSEENESLIVALHDAINAPKGVVPDSAAPFCDAALASTPTAADPAEQSTNGK